MYSFFPFLKTRGAPGLNHFKSLEGPFSTGLGPMFFPRYCARRYLFGYLAAHKTDKLHTLHGYWPSALGVSGAVPGSDTLPG